MSRAPSNLLRAPIRPQWLALSREDPLDPSLPIVDAHHHLWDRPGERYDLPSFLQDSSSGHRVEATVVVECGAYQLQTGPKHLRSVGETEAAVRAADRPDGISTSVGQGIVARIDLTDGDRVEEVIEAHRDVAGSRLKAVRHVTLWHPDPKWRSPTYDTWPHMMSNPSFRAGVTKLAPSGLAFEAWCYSSQLDELRDLARDHPDTTIVLDHLGNPLLSSSDTTESNSETLRWRESIRALAECPNVVIKIGGFGLLTWDVAWHDQELPPDSLQLARAWRPWFEIAVEAFTPSRCMLESNFPVDKGAFSYVALWNAFKRLSHGMSADERADLFHGTARRIYVLCDAARPSERK